MDFHATLHPSIISDENRKEGPVVSGSSEEDHQILTCTMLSQGDASNQPEPATEGLTTSDAVEAPKDEDGAQECSKVGTEEIIRELRIIRRQNRVTHWLVSVMIMVTAVWQMSEVSLLIMMKDRLSNPFKAVGGLIKGALRGGPNESDGGKSSSSSNQNNRERLALNPLKMLEPHNVIPTLNLNGSDDDDD